MPFYRAKFTIETEQEDELGLLKDQLAFAKDENGHQEGDWIQCVSLRSNSCGQSSKNSTICCLYDSTA